MDISKGCMCVVLHNISIISNQHRMRGQQPTYITYNSLDQHRITAKIGIKWQNRQKSVWFLKYWVTFWWNSCWSCSICQFWGMFGGIFGKFMLSQLYRKIEFKEQISNQTHKADIVQHYMRGIKELHRWDKVLELKDGCGAVIWGGGGL